ncbi:MAG: reverse transcriptase domain-containing protein, partial [Nitrososphaeraceae archaeon]
AENIMDCWHVDLIGPLSEVNKDGKRIHLPSLQGKIYILVIVDEYSRFVMVEPIQQKSDATESIINLIKQQQNATRLVLKRLHSDGGSEFNNKVLLDFLKKQGTEYTYTTSDTPELNGIAESTNKILTTMVRCMEEHGKLPLELWNYAYIHAAHIHNNVCQPSLQGGLVPAEIMFPNRKFNIDNIHTFGCNAHVLIENKRGKLQPKTNAGIYLGYHAQQHAHKILLIDSLRLQISRNVQFVEDSFTNANAIRKQIKESAEKASAVEDKEYEVEYISNHELRRGVLYYLIHWKGYELPTWESEDKLTNCAEVIDKYNKQLLHINIALAAAAVPKEIPRDANYPIPQSYKQAMAHPDKLLWEEAIQNELDSLAEFNTFTSCTLPTSRKTIDTRWVFAVKRNELNKIIKWKARLVAKGFQQIFGVDYNETFSPAVKIKSLKLLLAIAAQQNLEIKQLDFNTAFLNAILNEDIYVKTPEGYYNKPNMVLKLNKALYGLKQAPREWWLELDKFLKSLGYISSPIDECLYIKHIDGKTIYLPLYVDDTLAIYDKSIEHVWLADKKSLSNKFSIKDIGDCEWILHMAVVRDRKNHIITLSQEAYIKNILEQHNLMDIRPASTPHWHTDITIVPDKVEPEILNESEHHLYRSIVGSMLYAANITRLDISYVIGVLARYTHKPYNYHLAAAKHVLRYLRGTTNYKLTFGGNITNNDNNQLFNIIMYTDSNWANEKDNRKSTGGWLTTINNLPINWQSKKQNTIAQSSTEAEYYALTEAVNETRFVQQWFKFCCNLDLDIPIVIKCDNTGAIHMSDHSTNHNRTKHIDIKHFYIRDIIKQYPIRIEYIPTKDQLADILTKATTTQVFKDLIDKLYH